MSKDWKPAAKTLQSVLWVGAATLSLAYGVLANIERVSHLASELKLEIAVAQPTSLVFEFDGPSESVRPLRLDVPRSGSYALQLPLVHFRHLQATSADGTSFTLRSGQWSYASSSRLSSSRTKPLVQTANVHEFDGPPAKKRFGLRHTDRSALIFAFCALTSFFGLIAFRNKAVPLWGARLLAGTLVASLALSAACRLVQPIKVSFIADLHHSELWQVFIDDGSGFRESYSSILAVAPSDSPQSLQFLLPPTFAKSLHLRLDPGANAGPMVIRSLCVESQEAQCWSGPSVSGMVGGLTDAELRPLPQGVHLERASRDPQVHLLGDFSSLTQFIPQTTLVYVLLAAIASALLFSTLPAWFTALKSCLPNTAAQLKTSANKVALCATAAVAFSFFCCTLIACFTNSLHHDDSSIAVVAKNLALGHGYMMSANGELLKFDPGTTTGPTLVLPAALLIKLFGHQYWVPALACWIVIAFCMLGVWKSITHLYSGTHRIGPVALGTLLVMVVFSCDGVTDWGSRLYLWHRLVGEVVAGLLIYVGLASASLALTSSSRRGSLAVSAGVLLAAATLSKFMSVFSLAGLVLIIGGALYLQRSAWKSVLVTSTLIAAGYLPPLLAMKAAKWFVLTPEEAVQNKIRAGSFFMNTGSGLAALLGAPDKIAHLTRNVLSNWQVLISFMGGPTLFWAWLAVAASILIVAGRHPGARRAPWLFSWALIACFTVNFAWWICLGIGWLRHLEPALILLPAGLVGLLGTARRPMVQAGLGVLLLTVSSERFSHTRAAIPSLVHPEQRLVGLLQTRDYLIKERAKGMRLLQDSGWSNADLEYLLPGIQSFADYRSPAPEDEAGQRLGAYVYGDYPGFALPELANSEHCPSITLFSAAPFVVKRACKPTSLSQRP